MLKRTQLKLRELVYTSTSGNVVGFCVILSDLFYTQIKCTKAIKCAVQTTLSYLQY